MFPVFKRVPVLLVLLAVFAGTAAIHPQDQAQASVEDGVWFLDTYGIDGSDSCADGDLRDVQVLTGINSFSVRSMVDDGDTVQLRAGSTIFCIEPSPGDEITFNSQIVNDPAGAWRNPACGDDDSLNGDGDGIFAEYDAGDLADSDACIDAVGLAGANLTIPAAGNDISVVAVTFSCGAGRIIDISIRQADLDERTDFRVICGGEPHSISLSALPTTIESSPAIYSTSHSLIRAIVTDSGGGPVLSGSEVEFAISRCAISASNVNSASGRKTALDLFDTPPLEKYLELDAFSDTATPLSGPLTVPLMAVDTNDPPDGVPNHSEALAILHAEGCDPGPVTVTARIDRVGEPDIEATVTVTVVGPPAFLILTAAPTELICGEKSELTVSVTDALNHAVSDNTRIELVTTLGGTLAGTGTSLLNIQPVNPISSTTVEVFDGQGIAFLITSPQHHGPYEVLAATTTTAAFGHGQEETAPVTTQVTVTCTLGTGPEVIAPDTGTGVIRPPNTGDAGLADQGGASEILMVIAGALFIALGTIARRRFARN